MGSSGQFERPNKAKAGSSGPSDANAVSSGQGLEWSISSALAKPRMLEWPIRVSQRGRADSKSETFAGAVILTAEAVLSD